MIRITNLKLDVRKAWDEESEKQALRRLVLTKLKIRDNELIEFRIYKKSVDARKKDEIVYVYTIDAKTQREESLLKAGLKNILSAPDLLYPGIQSGSQRLPGRPVIVGMGPAGLFAGLILARSGYRPILLERGEDVDTRTADISCFWSGGLLKPDSNVQFGEGGAGTFSDGKLTTLIDDPRCRVVLEELIRAGAPEEILYQAKAHIGTDLLKNTVKKLRQSILDDGGEVRFRAKVTDFILRDGSVSGVIVNGQERLDSAVVLLAIGHSARDTFEVLHQRGVLMIPKPFSIGVRIEHQQTLIDRSQYGTAYATTPGLGAADYKLAYHSPSGRSAYTFCMCPGGYVVAAASEADGVVTNGMSEYGRDGANANSALLVGVSPEDFPGVHPLAGVEFQRIWERLAYQFGGKNYRAPVQLVGDFLEDRLSSGFGGVKPTYLPGVSFAMLKDCLPTYVIQTLKEALVYFNTKIAGFGSQDVLLTGVETRSSSPVRIIRNENNLSNIAGLYPVGEGAGYAGGIMSAAVDGIRTAEKVIAQYAPLAKS